MGLYVLSWECWLTVMCGHIHNLVQRSRIMFEKMALIISTMKDNLYGN